MNTKEHALATCPSKPSKQIIGRCSDKVPVPDEKKQKAGERERSGWITLCNIARRAESARVPVSLAAKGE
jgi:hypothetical protein